MQASPPYATILWVMHLVRLHSLLWLLSLLLLPAPLLAAPARVALTLEAAGDGAPRGGFMPLDVFALIAAGWHINAHQPNQPYLVPTELTLSLPAGVGQEQVHYPPPDRKHFSFAGEKELLVYEGKLGLATGIRIPADFAADRLRIEAVLRYQACNDTTCLPPTTAQAVLEVPVVAAAAGLETEGGTAAAPSRRAGAASAPQLDRWMRERGLLFTALAVLLLGVSLNLTPCVYPLISVTIAYFGGQSRAAGLKGSAVLYVLGIALSFSALGVAAALSGGLFGQALQKPALILAIAGVLIALALSSFGVYQLQPPAGLLRWAGGSGRGSAGALFMGLTMGIVAAPCVGPVVLGLLIFVGSRQDLLLGFLLFFALALGMGAPYLVLATAAGSIKLLPRSGEWLVWTERLFGCVLLIMAAYFVAPLLPAPAHDYLLPAAVAASGVYLGFLQSAGRALSYFPAVKRAVGLGMLGVAVWLAHPVATEQAIGWERFEAWSSDGRAAGGAHKPVLIEFGAEWCVPCREMEHTTYVDPAVVREAERFHMVKADLTQENEATTQLVNKYEVRGVPTIILFSADGVERQRLVGYVGPDELLGAMRAVN